MQTVSEYLKTKYGRKIYKLALSTGCTCPNRDGTLGRGGCIFCDGGGAFSEAGPVSAQLEAAKRRVAGKIPEDAGYIAYFQSFTNTYGDTEKLAKLFREAVEPADVVTLSVATRPDCIGEDMLQRLADINGIKPVWVELGLQTIRQESVKFIRRGYENGVYLDAVRRLRERGITVIAHMILGLPGETEADMAATARFIGESGAEGIKLHLLHVIEGTDLAEAWRRGEVRTMELGEYVSALRACLGELPEDMIIHRLTGDGDKRTLLAPMWSADKKRVINTLRRELPFLNL